MEEKERYVKYDPDNDGIITRTIYDTIEKKPIIVTVDRCIDLLNQQDKRIAELEQELAKYKELQDQLGLENADEFEWFVMLDILTDNEKNMHILDLHRELAKLKEKAIVPKFKIGQEVFIIDKNYFKIEHYKIAHCKVLGIEDKLDRKNNYVRWYTLKIYNSSYETDRRYKFKEKDVFATKEEAQEKLKEIQGNE